MRLGYGGKSMTMSVNCTAYAYTQLALDIFSLVLLFTNAFSHPRSTSQTVLKILLGEGFILFLVRASSISFHAALV